jgi:ABC-type nitrate/sulfonate/bicarbonate transport system substrate-binding protein
MKTFKIIGVPEHFNLPWEMAIESGDFEEQNIDLEWTDVKEGTGRMCEMLRNKEADIAVVLTEGILKDISLGNPSSIVQLYLETPLLWGIHVAANSSFQNISELENKKAAISRVGSGSQLMTYVNAKNQNWNVNNIPFKIVNSIDGAVKSLTDGESDYFMWEQFMTKPLVDSGIFRKIGICPTPWPCFVIAVRNEVLQNDADSISKILRIINNTTIEFKEIPSIDKTLAFNFNQKLEDINQWLELTEWSQKNMSEEMLNKIQNQLLELSILDKKVTFAQTVVNL